MYYTYQIILTRDYINSTWCKKSNYCGQTCKIKCISAACSHLQLKIVHLQSCFMSNIKKCLLSIINMPRCTSHTNKSIKKQSTHLSDFADTSEGCPSPNLYRRRQHGFMTQSHTPNNDKPYTLPLHANHTQSSIPVPWHVKWNMRATLRERC